MVGLVIREYLRLVVFRSMLVLMSTILIIGCIDVLFLNKLDNFFLTSLFSIILTLGISFLVGLTKEEKICIVDKIKQIHARL